MKTKKKTPVEIYRQRAAQADFCTLEEVSGPFIVCLLLMEDAPFFQHKGFDLFEMSWALRKALQGQPLHGGSTITQQLVKNLYFRFDASLLRKIKEAFLTRRFEKELTKMQILELYMNIIYFDNGQYGIHDASYFYFHKSPKELNLNQSVFLCALLPVVGVCNPLLYPEKFVQYRNSRLNCICGYAAKEQLAQITRHGPDCLDEELCSTNADAERRDRSGPMINERFGPGGWDCLIK